VDRSSIDQALKGKKASLSPDEAVSLAKSVKAEYVLFGSLTGSGQSISIDANLAPTQGSGEPVNLHTQTRNLDEVILASINLRRRSTVRCSVAAQRRRRQRPKRKPPLMSTRNFSCRKPCCPEARFPISILIFLEVTPEAALRQTGLWRSQTLREGILGMDIGDVDGDGRQEVVTVSQEKVTVFQRQEAALKTLANFSGNNMQRFLWFRWPIRTGTEKTKFM